MVLGKTHDAQIQVRCTTKRKSKGRKRSSANGSETIIIYFNIYVYMYLFIYCNMYLHIYIIIYLFIYIFM